MAEAQLAGFLARYDLAIRAVAEAALVRMRERLPGSVEMVYDNYNALVIGFVPGERASEALFSIALYPRWVTLFFLDGAGLPDPHRRLTGKGNRVRGIRLVNTATLDEPAVQALIAAALERAGQPFDPGVPRKLIIKSISPSQRPRRPIK